MKMFEVCFKRLSAGGKMIYTDIFRKTGIDRDGYLNQYFLMMKTKWTALNAAEYDLIYNHVDHYDFPSDLETTFKWLGQTGFVISDKLEPDNFHIMLVLGKQQSL
jgi:hypothetical protein